jgi:hypothetical protein
VRERGSAEKLMIPKPRSDGIDPMCRTTKFTNEKTASHPGSRKTTHCSGSEPGGHGHLDM